MKLPLGGAARKKFALKFSFLKFHLRAFAEELRLETQLCSKVQIPRLPDIGEPCRQLSRGSNGDLPCRLDLYEND